jgi:hypothetical protein
VERTSNSDQTYSAESLCVKRGFQPIGHKGREGKIDGLPAGPYGEMSPVGLPGPNIIWCTEMYRVFFTIPADDDAHSGEAGGVNGLSRGA